MARNRRKIYPVSEAKETVGRKRIRLDIKYNRQQGSGIRCPLKSCRGRTKVYHSIASPDTNEQKRYRKCDRCGMKIYTIETIERYIKE